MNVPFVVLLDLDGTLIGNIAPQIGTYHLHGALKAKGVRSGCLCGKVLQDTLRSGVVRPYVAQFVRAVHKAVPDAMFFVYTASEKRWANFIVTHVEKAIGVKFARPIFTRSDCTTDARTGEIKKCVGSVLEKIVKALARKDPRAYGSLRAEDLAHRWMMVDNTTSVFDAAELSNVVPCPTYAFEHTENVLGGLSPGTCERNRDVIVDLMRRQGLLNAAIRRVDDWASLQVAFYTAYARRVAELRGSNASQRARDTFFMDLARVLAHERHHHRTISVDRVKTHMRALSSAAVAAASTRGGRGCSL